MLRTTSGKEEITAAICRKMFSGCDIIYPKRRVCWRKCGQMISLIRPLFEGYLFVSSESTKIQNFDRLLHKYEFNVGGLVYSAGALIPILTKEKELIRKLMGNEGIVEVSEIEKIDNQIKVVTGPLVGFEPLIKKFSGRNRRITVEIPILAENRQIELGGVWKNPEYKPPDLCKSPDSEINDKQICSEVPKSGGMGRKRRKVMLR